MLARRRRLRGNFARSFLRRKVVRPTYGLSNEVIRTAIGWLAILYTMMIVGISLQGLWYLSKSEIAAAHRNALPPSPQARERK